MSGVGLDTAFHPDHIADLRASGLTDSIIGELKIESVRPQDISKLAGFNPPGVTSALLFPYPGEEKFYRIKVFPPYKDKDGHFVKYLQPPNSGCRLYILPHTAKVLSDPSKPIAYTEGEKKAARACQGGIATIGLGGLWNWLEDGKPIPKLDEIAHADRMEIIYADSDVWTKPGLQDAVYAFGRELESRGARVSVGIIPPGADGVKRGLDDFLVLTEANGISAFEALNELKKIPLKHATFSRSASWWKGWDKRRRQEKPSVDAMRLLERIERVRTIHPAQDFVDGIFLYGVPADEDVLLVTSERKLVTASDLPHDVHLETRGFDLCRFSKEGIMRFLGGATEDGHGLLRKLEQFFPRYIIFRDARVSLLLAAWTMGTYTHRVFRVFPYLALRSPTKRCGKSRVLDLLSLAAFNASTRILNPTEAQLFRGPSKNAGSLMLDEIEHLRGNKEAFQAVLQVLNSRYERGGVVTRLEKTREGKYEEVRFPTYAPLALAGISRLAETLEDRAILIFMARKTRAEKVERFSPGRLEVEAQALRDACYIWALTHAADLAEVYEADAFPGLDVLDDRARDLWEPLISIALLADAEAEGTGDRTEFAKTLAELAADLSGVRDEGDTTINMLIGALIYIRKEKDRETFTPSELLKLLKPMGFDWVRSTRHLAGLLNPLGLMARSDKILVEGQRKSVRHYYLDHATLDDLRCRYGSPSEEAQEEA